MSLNNAKSIATLSLSGTLIDKLEAIAYAGFDGLEIWEDDLLAFDGEPEQISRIAEDLGLKILLFQPLRDFEGVSREELKKNLEKAKRKFEIMNRLNVDKMLLCSNTMLNAISDELVIINDLRLLAECAEEYGVKIGYEALSWGKYIKSYKHAWKIVETVNHPCFGLILDSFHTLAMDDELAALCMLPHNKIFFVQLSDALRMNGDFLERSRHFRCYPGQGDLDVMEFLTKVLSTGYTGPLSLEIFSDKLKLQSSRNAAVEGMMSFRNLENNIAAYL